MSTTCRRRRTKPLKRSLDASLGGLGAGHIVRAKRKITPASIRSVLASWPDARAKSRTWRGLATVTGIALAFSLCTRARPYPPVASHTTCGDVTVFRHPTRSSSPSGSLAIRRTGTASPNATSRCSLAISTPTKSGTIPVMTASSLHAGSDARATVRDTLIRGGQPG